MNFWVKFLEILDTEMTTPEPYGWFHLLFWGLTILGAVLLCVLHDREKPDRVRKIVLWVAVIVAVMEIYKQINFSFAYDNGVATFEYPWSAFPWQFCSMPMYVGLLAGLIRRGKVHDALCAFLATYAMFAGLCVMFYPSTIFIPTIGVNIQTSFCHGSMIAVGVYLLYSGHMRLRHKTILGAMAVFACAMLVAIVLNEIAFAAGLTEAHDFNMFYISRHEDPHLPVYSLLQPLLPYPVELMVYFSAFSLASYLILLAAMGIQKLSRKLRKESEQATESEAQSERSEPALKP